MTDHGRLIAEQTQEVEGLRDESPQELEAFQRSAEFAGKISTDVTSIDGRSLGYSQPGATEDIEDEILRSERQRKREHGV